MNDTQPDDEKSVLPLRLIDLEIRAGSRVLITDTNVTIAAGKITVIVGGSGAGKSVLLRALAGLLPSDGEVISWTGQIDLGEPAAETTRSSNLAKRVGIVFQQFALFDELSPTANVQFAIDHRSDPKKPPLQSAPEWLDELGVPMQTGVAALSGGQKQRLAIARTLAADPEVILYDEPTSGLDAASGRKVAELIRHTQAMHRRTSIVVTHDYDTLLPIADEVLLLDSQQKRLLPIPKDQWARVPERMKPVQFDEQGVPEPRPHSWATRYALLARRAVDDFLAATGSALATTVCLPSELRPVFPHLRWGLRFVLHYLRLVGGPSAWVYLILAGLIIGFTSTYFTFRFLPFRAYTQPLLIDELLASVGFALYRILVPVLATVLIAARCGAAVAADVGVKRYGGQVDALRTLGVKPRAYLLLPIVIAFLIATPMLQWLSFSAAKMISVVTFVAAYPSIGPHFWQQHFLRNLTSDTSLFLAGWKWVLAKNLLCGFGTAVIAYYRGLSPKDSASDVSHAITSTVLWTTLYVLVVHFVVALIEF
ncbi:ABC transporter permease [Novipirellula artificiosorum]|uniref:Glutamine transport ATP-binding protein GlnQ n=1 Tax=Novipirellula artificiosorum TaxID=2528016 RepID=A0A5C6DW45_9BACT|nr:ABC transporter permease [Novipirellula artificiosorum]TWU39276.1 Glutamine transport ATP-binding protein GlnQ [Novipirellula artificiosorum]